MAADTRPLEHARPRNSGCTCWSHMHVCAPWYSVLKGRFVGIASQHPLQGPRTLRIRQPMFMCSRLQARKMDQAFHAPKLQLLLSEATIVDIIASQRSTGGESTSESRARDELAKVRVTLLKARPTRCARLLRRQLNVCSLACRSCRATARFKGRSARR